MSTFIAVQLISTCEIMPRPQAPRLTGYIRRFGRVSAPNQDKVEVHDRGVDENLQKRRKKRDLKKENG